jgi:predicted RNase H-like HicB family nuclease
MTHHLTAILEREGDGFVALCPELDIASQGSSRDEARANLREAVEAFLEAADVEEIRNRMPREMSIERLEVEVG